jgi:brefeldin A-inhibited guanine nucleotide-exchange protein
LIQAELRNDARNKPLTQFIQITDAEKYFLPFELACKCKSSRVIETSLDCIQVIRFFKQVFKMIVHLFDLKKLIAHGYLNESSLMAPTSTINKQQLIQRITKTISQCFEGPHIEDSVQLQIVKVLTRMKLF